MPPINPVWQDAEGNPITGRAPTSFRTRNGVTLSREQHSGVTYAYRQFCGAIARTNHPKGYHSKDMEIADGTRIRMLSVNGVHQVHVWPAGGNVAVEMDTQIPHGFAISSAYSAPAIYGKSLTTGAWTFFGGHVPQARKDIFASNQTLIPRPGKTPPYVVHPLVSAGDGLWDWALHSGPGSATTPAACPIALHIRPESESTPFNPHPSHYAIGRWIQDKSGANLYTMGVHPKINEWDSDDPRIGCAASDSLGTMVVLNTFRDATITLTSETYYMTFANERVERTAAAVYALAERNDVGLYPKVYSPHDPSSTSALYTTVGESPDWSELYQMIYGTDGLSAGYIGGYAGSAAMYTATNVPGGITWVRGPLYGGTTAYMWGFFEEVVDLTPYRAQDDYAARQETNQVAGPPVSYAKVVALPGASGAEYAGLEYDLSYPYTYYWRAGQASKSANKPAPGGGVHYGHYISYKLFDRRDLYRLMDTTGRVTLKLGWVDVDILAASVYGKCEGTLHKNDVYKGSNPGPFTTGGLVSSAPAPGVDSPPLPSVYSVPLGTSVEAYNDKYDLYLGAEKNSYINGIAYDPSYNTHTLTTILDTASHVDGQYVYTSRHIIDYDHRAQFFAAIKFVVQCENARWDQDPALPRGMCKITTNPTYTVSIYFESNWNGVSSERLLTSATATRQAYEFNYYTDGNPFDWRDGHSVTTVQMPMPPVVAPEVECLRQLLNLTNHQGVSPHFAAEDRFTPDDILAKSATGIEFSTLSGGVETPHNKYATGMLYARTFKIGDFMDSLWMLRALKVNCKENDAPDYIAGPAWFYFQALKTTIDTTLFHVELRDGVLFDWSDGITPAMAPGVTPPTPKAVPAPTERNISVHRV